MNSIFVFLTMLATSTIALAAGGEAHGAVEMDEHTKSVIMYQAINVGLILVAGIYYLRQPIKEFFAARLAGYMDAAEKTQAAKQAAQKEFDNIRAQLMKLETTAQESIARARAESSDLRKQLLADAEASASRIRTEAQNVTQIEVQKAVGELRAQMVADAISAAQSQLKSGVTQEDHQRLNKEFIRNIETVQP